jgi:5-methylcytosine-specific restriction endonuclease McrA
VCRWEWRIGITKVASKLTKVGSSAIVPTHLLIALQRFHNKKKHRLIRTY